MELEQHERIILQMLKEIQTQSMPFSGKEHHRIFLHKNNLMKAVYGNGGFKSGRPRYKLTPHGEGMLHHLKNKYEGVSHDGIENGSGCAPEQGIPSEDAGRG